MKNYVIIGAMDGVSHDNIFDRLKDETDYQAYFIEPVPHYFDRLKENVKQLSNANAYNFFISDNDGSVEMAFVKPEWIGKDSAFLDGCSSMVENGEPLNRYLKELPKSILSIISVSAMTFDQFCKWYNINDIYYIEYEQEIYETDSEDSDSDYTTDSDIDSESMSNSDLSFSESYEYSDSDFEYEHNLPYDGRPY